MTNGERSNTMTEEKFPTVPFTEDLSKAEMIAHLKELHDVTSVRRRRG